jgi:hypothetical protein
MIVVQASAENSIADILRGQWVEAHWLPSRCKMVIVSELNGNRIAVHVDLGRPGACRDQPYYDEIKRWSAYTAEKVMQVILCIGKRAIVIFPHADVDLGDIEDNDRIVTWETSGPTYGTPKRSMSMIRASKAWRWESHRGG